MDTQSEIVLEGQIYLLELSGNEKSRSWTDTRSSERDGEYDVYKSERKWQGVLQLTNKKTNDFFEINFETFLLENTDRYAVPRHSMSMEDMVLHSVKNFKKEFDRALLADFLGKQVEHLIASRMAAMDRGLRGVTMFFLQHEYEEELLLSEGILIESSGQMRIPVTT